MGVHHHAWAKRHLEAGWLGLGSCGKVFEEQGVWIASCSQLGTRQGDRGPKVGTYGEERHGLDKMPSSCQGVPGPLPPTSGPPWSWPVAPWCQRARRGASLGR